MVLELIEAKESTLDATRNKPEATNLQITIDLSGVAANNNVYDGNAAPPTGSVFLFDIADAGVDTAQALKPNVIESN